MPVGMQMPEGMEVTGEAENTEAEDAADEAGTAESDGSDIGTGISDSDSGRTGSRVRSDDAAQEDSDGLRLMVTCAAVLVIGIAIAAIFKGKTE